MRASLCFAAAFLLAVTVVACGDDDEASDATTTTSTAAAATTIPSAADPEAMLLTADDIEATLEGTDGWNVELIDYEEGLAGYLELPCDEVALDPMIVERLTADIEAYQGALDSCVTVSTGPETPTTVQELDLPELGDEQWC